MSILPKMLVEQLINMAEEDLLHLLEAGVSQRFPFLRRFPDKILFDGERVISG